MSQRFRLFEVDSQSQWAENPLDPAAFRLMPRFPPWEPSPHPKPMS
jgi:hypothetical protein